MQGGAQRMREASKTKNPKGEFPPKHDHRHRCRKPAACCLLNAACRALLLLLLQPLLLQQLLQKLLADVLSHERTVSPQKRRNCISKGHRFAKKWRRAPSTKKMP